MLGLYILVVDIVATDDSISLEGFQHEVSECLSYLHALKGSFDRVPCSITYYPPYESLDNPDFGRWSLRAVVSISLGKQRADYLHTLYQGVAKLIAMELPHSEVRAEISGFQFS